MKKFGRVICVTVLALALGLTGCGKDSDKKDNKETTAVTEAKTEGTTAASESEKTEATEADKSEATEAEKTEATEADKTEAEKTEATEADKTEADKTEEKSEETETKKEDSEASTEAASSEEASGENIEEVSIYVGTGDEYKEVKCNIGSELSVEDKAAAIINEIGYAIGYQVSTIEITSGKGGFSVGFSADSAPFDVENTYRGNGEEVYPVKGQEEVAKVVFDSIKESFKKYFGESVDVYYSLNDGDITIGSITISATEPY